MIRLTLVLLAWDTSVDGQSIPMCQSVPVGGLEREFIALPSVLALVWRLSASVADLAASLAAPRLGHFERLRGVSGSLLVIVHCRREFHAVDTCGWVSMGTSNTVTVALDINTVAHDFADFCLHSQRLRCIIDAMLSSPVMSP